MITVMTTSGEKEFLNSDTLEATYPKAKYDYIRANGKTYIVPKSKS